MFGVYLFTAVVGWAFVAFFILFGGDADLDADFDVDADFDLDADFDGAGGGLAGVAGDFLSFRSLVFFLAFFGITGIVLDFLGAAGLVALVAAVGMGVFAVWFNTRLVRFLKRSQLNTRLRNADMSGRPAEVVLPVGDGRKGRVRFDVAGNRMYLTATPFRSGERFAVGARVVVVEVENGTARVAAMDELE